MSTTSSNYECPVCKIVIGPGKGDVTAHAVVCTGTCPSTDPAGNTYSGTLAAYINTYAQRKVTTVTPTVKPATSGFDSFAGKLGISLKAATDKKRGGAGGGGMCTTEEIATLVEIAKDLSTKVIDPTSLFVEIVHKFIETDATEEMRGYGNIEPEEATSSDRVPISFSAMFQAFKKRHPEREMTPRMIARGLGPFIAWMSENNKEMIEYRQSGTSISNQYDAPAEAYLAAYSFFPFVKHPSEWSTAEANLHRAKLDGITKISTDSKVTPTKKLTPGGAAMSMVRAPSMPSLSGGGPSMFDPTSVGAMNPFQAAMFAAMMGGRRGY